MGKKINELTAVAAAAGYLIEMSRPHPTATITASTISAQASDNSFNDSGSGFVAANFAVGMSVKVTGFTGNVANNIVSGRITALTTAKMTLGGTDGDVIVDDAAGESVTITAWQSVAGTAQSVADLGGGDVANDAIWDAAGDLAVGTGANTAAKLTMGSALQVLRVNAAGNALEWAAASGGSSVTYRESTASFTRPNDTTTYTAGDVICDSTSAPTIMTFANVVANNGDGGKLTADLLQTVAQALALDATLELFTAAPTMQNDNAAWGPSDAEMLDHVATIRFSGGDRAASANNSKTQGYPMEKPFKCAAGSTSLFGVLVARNGYIPAAQEVPAVKLTIS
jgi:hypothetical protein